MNKKKIGIICGGGGAPPGKGIGGGGAGARGRHSGGKTR